MNDPDDGAGWRQQQECEEREQQEIDERAFLEWVAALEAAKRQEEEHEGQR